MVPDVSSFFHLHAHSEFSPLDGMPKVKDMVAHAVRNGQKGLALTDHGYMSGTHQLYKEAKEAGIVPFPGSEFYITPDHRDKEGPRYHVCMTALNKDGWTELVRLSSLSHTRERYHRKPRIDFSDLAMLDGHTGILLTTGCFGGLVMQQLIHGGHKAACHAVEMYRNWIPNTYIEVQHHGVGSREDGPSDDNMVESLYRVHKDTGVPLVIAQDAHYLKLSEQAVHDTMKSIAVPWLSDGDAKFQGNGFHLASASWMEHQYEKFPEVWEASEESMETVLMLNELALPALDKYSYHVPITSKNPDRDLRKMTEASLKAMDIDERVYFDRLDYELEVIQQLGFASYFLLVNEYVDWAKSKGIMVNARGSASGSLVCYLLGITQLDPIEWGLLFERFLSVDRQRPPDIDLDVEDIYRDDVIEYIRKRFYIRQIGTFSTMSINEFGKGSILVQYLSKKRKALGDQFPRLYGGVTTLDDLPDEEAVQLRKLGEMGVRKAAGAHAAGFAVSADDRSLDEYLPTMLIPSSGHTVTQMTMDDVEDSGYIKVDVLGLRSLTTLKRTLEYIGMDSLDEIPMNDSTTLREMRRGHTEAVFQFEGWAAQKGCREVKVSKTKDCIDVMALYRPATMASGYTNTYLQNKKTRGKNVMYPHPIFKKHLSRTYGVAIYQEQIMSIMRELGIPTDDLNKFLKALKMSNDKAGRAERTFRDQRDKFLSVAESKGMTRDGAVEAWGFLSGFAGYGFNESHATAYGLVGYRAMYLKVHHPTEYMAAVLETTAGTDKEARYIKEARRLKVRILPPDINDGGWNWRLAKDGRGLRKGLLSIKGVGKAAAEEIIDNAPYESVEDLIARTTSRIVTGGSTWPKEAKGVIGHLKGAGALSSLGIGAFDG